MIARRNGFGHECVVVDVNTQYDFCSAVGVRPVANIAELIPALRRIVAWTKRNHAPVVSCIESRRACESAERRFEGYCIDGTVGQRKLGFTVFPQSLHVEVDNNPACPIDLFRKYQQVIFRKRTEDLLGNPKADRFLTQVPTQQFIICGVGLEEGIKQLVLGLLARRKRVVVVGDASGYWNNALAELALEKMHAKGAAIITTHELLHRRLRREHRYLCTYRSFRNGRSLRHARQAKWSA